MKYAISVDTVLQAALPYLLDSSCWIRSQSAELRSNCKPLYSRLRTRNDRRLDKPWPSTHQNGQGATAEGPKRLDMGAYARTQNTLGLGIRPFGPRILPARASGLMKSGVATMLSKSTALPALSMICWIRASSPITSAPEDQATTSVKSPVLSLGQPLDAPKGM